MKDIQGKIELCKSAFVEMFPIIPPHTIKVLLWDDGDYEVRLRHGKGDIIHDFIYYSQEPKVKHEVSELQSAAIKVDCKGRECYIPDELIPYLNNPDLLKK